MKNTVNPQWFSLSTQGFAEFMKDAREEWRKLRVYYMKQRKLARNEHSGDGAESTFVPTWQFYKELQFLSDSCQQRDSQSNWLETPPASVEGQTDNESFTLELVDHNDINFNEDSILDVQTSSESAGSSQSAFSKQQTPTLPSTLRNRLTFEQRKKRKLEEDESKTAVELMGTISDSIKKKSTETGNDHFCSQVLFYLKEIPECLEKDNVKLSILQQIVQCKYSAARI